MFVAIVHAFMPLLAGKFCSLACVCGSEVADGCLALVQLVPMAQSVKGDGSVVTWGILYFVMGACARWGLAVCSCWHETFVGRYRQFLRWPPITVFLF